jgi:hypothetical protein
VARSHRSPRRNHPLAHRAIPRTTREAHR